jgi:hypothetical protein
VFASYLPTISKSDSHRTGGLVGFNGNQESSGIFSHKNVAMRVSFLGKSLFLDLKKKTSTYLPSTDRFLTFRFYSRLSSFALFTEFRCNKEKKIKTCSTLSNHHVCRNFESL